MTTFKINPTLADIRVVTDPLYERVSGHIPHMEWGVHAENIYHILRLKAERGAVILAHHYQPPEIALTVADFRGDSLQLARVAATRREGTIVQAGVHFMAETSKIICPEKRVLIPSRLAGCSLAASITGADVRQLKKDHPKVPVVTYVNTSAEVKAESDVCCTSSNALAIVEDIARDWGVDEVIFIPDQYLAANTQTQTKVRLITWPGSCEVHVKFTAAQLRELRKMHPGLIVLAHPECPPDVIKEADISGSTSVMMKFVDDLDPTKKYKVAMITECAMGETLALRHPEVEFLQPCNFCPHMGRITLPNIRLSLERLQFEVTVDPEISQRARIAIDRMLAVGKPASTQ